MNANEDSDAMSVQDAIRLKHGLNKSIKCHGYDAREIQELKRLTTEQFEELNEGISILRDAWWFFSDRTMVIGFLISGCSLLYFASDIARLFCIVGMIYFATQVSYRYGVWYGYTRGFEYGHEKGVEKVLGISAVESTEMHKRATEMAVDERLIQRLDRAGED
jgi:hypothetical protein